ncbi:flagellar hook-associated protein FlgK [Populibacterium corticicola]|jgi:flagellar hook-associated protein 1 FlgK|uniref:Flagellar hook-associated protein 1 n=1 Tax=Populibacterium corticicola TaxID=1812826 RepID=A0ABW5XLL5_9MICO
MSTFSGLSTALSSLNAQRIAMEVTGQNIANANTVGYTRQRAELASVGAGQTASLFSEGSKIGNGVKVTDVSRLGDIFLDARVRATTSSAAFLAARADVYTRLESAVSEPSDTGIASALSEMWSAWQDVAKAPQTLATKQVLLEQSKHVSASISAGYSAIETQWSQVRTEAAARVSDVNALADGVAELNGQIRQILVSDGNANELIDQRNQLITQLSNLAGATVRFQENGTADVYVGGNPLVTADRAQHMKIAGSTDLAGVLAGNAPVQIVWERAGEPVVTFDGGEIQGKLSALAPVGQGGILTEAAEQYNELARQIASQINGVLGSEGPLFAIGTDPAARNLEVVITNPADVPSATPGMGEYDGSLADAVSQLANAENGPSQLFQTFVVGLGVSAKATYNSAIVAESARATAQNLQIAATSVDIDEETVNLLTYQRGYQAASRVMTAIDEMLDTLINRTGVVGR